MSHPLDVFRYCPRCGSSHWAVNDFKSKHCADCGFTYYANPSSATAAFIVRPTAYGGQELLVVRRAKDPARGTLDLPGGFVDMDETAEQGMRREIMEETGLKVGNVSYLFSIPNRYEYSGMVIHSLDMFYQCEVDAGAVPRAADDAAACQWVPTGKLRPADFGLESIRQAVARFIGLP